MLAVNDFATNGKWPRGSNSSFLCLIPKVENPQQLDDFRPISLVGCLYKILSKALSLRLLDSVLVANEGLEEVKSKKKSCVFFKVDYEKTYDSISWEFIYYMLEMLDFRGK